MVTRTDGRMGTEPRDIQVAKSGEADDGREVGSLDKETIQGDGQVSGWMRMAFTEMRRLGGKA